MSDMRANLILIVFFFFALIVSCKDPQQVPAKVVTLDSSADNGFYFETEEIMRYPFVTPEPDIIVAVQQQPDGAKVGPFLAGVDLKTKFLLTNSFSDIESASQFFNSYEEAVLATYEVTALNLIPNQVWTIETVAGKFVKILILESSLKIVNGNSVAALKFQWEYLK